MSAELKSQAAHEASLFGFISRQFAKPKPLPAGIRLTNQVAIVSGSNVGLGLEASRQLLALGLSHLVMAVRTQSKGDAAAAALRKDFPAAEVSVWTVDQESYKSVVAFAKRCETLERIDIVVLNAGLIQTKYTVSAETKHEITLQVNYLSTALLAILLLPLLKAKKQPGTVPAMTIVGSDIAFGATVDADSPVLPQLDDASKFSPHWYAKSKLLQALFVSKLGELVDPEDVLVNLSNPGMTGDTSFFRNAGGLMRGFMTVLQALLARSLEAGASNYVDAVLAHGRASHGSFVSDWAIKPWPKMWYTPEGQRAATRLWEETMEELNFAGVSKILSDLKAR
ncbi:hypothetical protein S40288_00871 [Stachybotrys chartarum IBT 40288]|nr:hypothetical protein S40288_00871 [Stachybotrys chartarum IBT 40288]